jgi:hypothetical protein
VLIFDASHENMGMYIKPLVEDLARSHISRYPLHANVVNGSCVEFNDTRLSKVASLSWGNDARGMQRYCISSFRIKNPKYHVNNPKYHAKFTNDPKKALKLLKEVVVPFSPVELTTALWESARAAYNKWKWEANAKFSEVSKHKRVDLGLVMDDVSAFKSTGVPYTKLSTYMDDDFIAAYKEMRDRDNSVKPTINVYINEDGMTHVVNTAIAPNALVATFDSYEQLPQSVLSKVAMLKLTEADTFVSGVGIKQASGNSFWVYE